MGVVLKLFSYPLSGDTNFTKILGDGESVPSGKIYESLASTHLQIVY